MSFFCDCRSNAKPVNDQMLLGLRRTVVLGLECEARREYYQNKWLFRIDSCHLHQILTNVFDAVTTNSLTNYLVWHLSQICFLAIFRFNKWQTQKFSILKSNIFVWKTWTTFVNKWNNMEKLIYFFVLSVEHRNRMPSKQKFELLRIHFVKNLIAPQLIEGEKDGFHNCCIWHGKNTSLLQ